MLICLINSLERSVNQIGRFGEDLECVSLMVAEVSQCRSQLEAVFVKIMKVEKYLAEMQLISMQRRLSDMKIEKVRQFDSFKYIERKNIENHRILLEKERIEEQKRTREKLEHDFIKSMEAYKQTKVVSTSSSSSTSLQNTVHSNSKSNDGNESLLTLSTMEVEEDSCDKDNLNTFLSDENSIIIINVEKEKIESDNDKEENEIDFDILVGFDEPNLI